MVVVVLTLSFLLVTCNISFEHIGFDCNEALLDGRRAPCDANAFPRDLRTN